ncbi:MAG: CYTH domain-containing protein [Gammaproteobacteria bacterium]|nr:CYTH domain-containing protein [Gammaproteobacteria bacterium]
MPSYFAKHTGHSKEAESWVKSIERKYLVEGDAWRSLADGKRYRQGYLSTVRERTVRVRTVGERGYLTIKGENEGIARAEFEYGIPFDDANELLDGLCERPLIEKDRYKISDGDLTWEVDDFFGDNAGLVLAEVELESEDQSFEKPGWIAREVSDDPRYYNVNLIANPYKNWADNP